MRGPPPLRVVMDVKNLDALNPDQLAGLRPALRRVSFLAAQWLQQLWIEVAQRRLPHGSGAYIRGITSESSGGTGVIRLIEEKGTTIDSTGEISVTLEIVNTAPHASIVEDGHPGFHLPSRINWAKTGGGVHIGKNGPYLRIPFRHSAYATPQERINNGATMATIKAMMPKHIYEEASKLRRSLRGGAGSPSRPGGRLDRSGVTPAIHLPGPGGGSAEGYEERRSARVVGHNADRSPIINPAWGSSKWHGLFKTGAPGHSQYMTVRTITPTSPGWNIPAQVGYGIARQVAIAANAGDNLQNFVQQGMRSAVDGLTGGTDGK